MRSINMRVAILAAAAVLLSGAAPAAAAGTAKQAGAGSVEAATKAKPADPTAYGRHAVATADYSLGDSAFAIPGFHTFGTDQVAPLELAGRVHYPRDLTKGRYPLVMFAHGLFSTCADRAASAEFDAATGVLYGPDAPEDEAEVARLEAIIERTGALLNQWPCAPGTPGIPSLRGYDYVARQLASHGFVVVSIGVNGVNIGDMGQDQDDARAKVANKHLKMWRDLVTSGRGALAGRLPAAFRGHVDLQRVGLVGHSRGGRGVMTQAADVNASSIPEGVRLGAVLGLEAVGYFRADDDPQWETPYLVTRIPSASIVGTCGYGSTDYFDHLRGRNQAPAHLWTIHGANHNFFNTQWSPESGQVQAVDDALPLPEPGKCGPEGALDRKLSEAQQRRVGAAYISAFFRRYLGGEKSLDPMLTGRTHPMAGITAVDVRSS
ncbi:hypothetical protein JIG36_41780 [Actinoplanes sp. LDG1-06]|uniref:PET hydrolase/cutinase-like domain-containing protein n=1 Tax=Paractinoplanes ovalisporus TaxID=2810368 RepID=A0ABS2ASC4_9ACTN|nr:hypothetical protein [Actinoplanes ovalisporus]MBM2622054.1 hypothetical protein [Actinoplanes ovalisporus]